MTNSYEEVSIKAILTGAIKKQIDDGKLKIEGLQLRDSRGRYATPLNTLLVKEKLKYSPALMVQFQNEFLVTLSIINRDIRAGFREQSEKLSRIERKLDQLIKNEIDKLNAEVNFFFSEVDDLEKCDTSRIEQLLFNGGKTVALLAQKIEQFMDEYIDSIEHKNSHNNNNNNIMTYGELKEGKEKENWPTRNIVEYPRFNGSSAEVYTHAFLEMLNSLNILSLIHRDRGAPDYLINLDVVKDKLLGLLKKLSIDDLQKHFNHNYPGFRDMCYQLSPNSKNNEEYIYRGNSEARRLEAYFNEFSSDKLAIRERIVANYTVYQDEHLHCAITDILNMLENIDNLKLRASTLPNTIEERNQAISILSDKFFLATHGAD
ncbi:hypothetical protein [Moellerella wisconsensis]|uniref:hypothetical protein n=1 Tax=Moellerella wisconsensis TaxID=158849 RepID=UPI0024104FC0|nr:hypothetical protein [Moellerella wisconsensis]